MSEKNDLKRWRFRIEDWDDNTFHLGSTGNEVDEDNQEEWFIGTQREADIEADRRANLWEDRTDALVSHIVSESRGKII